MNSANSNGITPSIDEILSAVNDELDERICVKPVSEVTAQVDNSTVKNETEGVDLFNASQWYLQNYPVKEKKTEPTKTSIAAESRKEPVKVFNTIEPNKPKKSHKGIGIALAIIAFIALVIYLVSISGAFSSYDSVVYDGGYVADVSGNEYLHLNQPKDLNIGVNELIYMNFIPDSSGNYNVYSYGQTDTIARIYDNNGDLIGEYDDGNENFNFNFNIYLNAGEEYTFEFAAYAPGGDTTIKIIKG